MPALNDVLRVRQRQADTEGLVRRLSTITPEASGPHLYHNTERYLHFSSNDYLGLRTHPNVVQAAQLALADYGAGSGASRLVVGEHPLFADLESSLATYKSREAALVFGSGYLANIGAITALMQPGDLILADKLIHACMLDGALLSGASLKRFRHNDAAHAEQLLDRYRLAHRHCLILTESVFSMDGDAGATDTLFHLARRFDSWLMVDDAHGLGFVPPGEADIISGTMSKALGSYGGYIATTSEVKNYLIGHARSFMFSTGLPASVVASAHAALAIMCAEPQRAQHALAMANILRQALGMEAGVSPIVPVVLGTAQAALAASGALRKHGIWVQAIRPPTVPEGSSRLRITVNAMHTEQHIEQLLAVLLPMMETACSA